MARGLNRVQLIGHVGRKPESRTTPSGSQVASLSIAINEQWKDKSGETKEHTEWVNCVAFGRLAEIIDQYVTSGSHLYVEGKLKTEKWQDKQGVDRYSTKVYLDLMHMLGGSKQEAMKSRGERERDEREPAQRAPSRDGDEPERERSDIPF